jgi:hypothetical protein
LESGYGRNFWKKQRCNPTKNRARKPEKRQHRSPKEISDDVTAQMNDVTALVNDVTAEVNGVTAKNVCDVTETLVSFFHCLCPHPAQSLFREDHVRGRELHGEDVVVVVPVLPDGLQQVPHFRPRLGPAVRVGLAGVDPSVDVLQMLRKDVLSSGNLQEKRREIVD